ncbi:hypothetical protein BHE74_00055047 [Ensete ventricosum]|nr:hypothetical protein BHE74_00055047 [Ensete ventricosum]
MARQQIPEVSSVHCRGLGSANLGRERSCLLPSRPSESSAKHGRITLPCAFSLSKSQSKTLSYIISTMFFFLHRFPIPLPVNVPVNLPWTPPCAPRCVYISCRGSRQLPIANPSPSLASKGLIHIIATGDRSWEMEDRHSGRSDSGSIVSELEGTLLDDVDPFPYFMLLAFETSGLIRFAALLFLWPVLRLLDSIGMAGLSLQLTVFVAVAGVRESEIEAVARAVLPKFFMDDVNMAAWSVFSSFKRKVVVTSWPRLMVERFVKDHLHADDVVGRELEITRFGYATGFFKRVEKDSPQCKLRAIFKDDKPDAGFGRPTSAQSFLSICKVQRLLICP